MRFPVGSPLNHEMCSQHGDHSQGLSLATLDRRNAMYPAALQLDMSGVFETGKLPELEQLPCLPGLIEQLFAACRLPLGRQNSVEAWKQWIY